MEPPKKSRLADAAIGLGTNVLAAPIVFGLGVLFMGYLGHRDGDWGLVLTQGAIVTAATLALVNQGAAIAERRRRLEREARIDAEREAESQRAQADRRQIQALLGGPQLERTPEDMRREFREWLDQAGCEIGTISKAEFDFGISVVDSKRRSSWTIYKLKKEEWIYITSANGIPRSTAVAAKANSPTFVHDILIHLTQMGLSYRIDWAKDEPTIVAAIGSAAHFIPDEVATAPGLWRAIHLVQAGSLLIGLLVDKAAGIARKGGPPDTMLIVEAPDNKPPQPNT